MSTSTPSQSKRRAAGTLDPEAEQVTDTLRGKAFTVRGETLPVPRKAVSFGEGKKEVAVKCLSLAAAMEGLVLERKAWAEETAFSAMNEAA